MNLRGIARAAAAATVAAVFVGAFGAPARADDPFPGALLNLSEPGVTAASAPNKGCAGIDTGVAVPGADGWLFSRPAGRYTDLTYLFVYVDGSEAVGVVLDAKGVVEVDTSAVQPEAVKNQLSAKSGKDVSAKDVVPPTKPARPGLTGKLTDDGGWVRTPEGWGLYFGGAVSDPLPQEGATFDLVRTCAAAAASPSPSVRPSTSPSGGPSLPVTGDNTGLIVGVGAGMVLAGAVLFVAYRRRRGVKFVA